MHPIARLTFTLIATGSLLGHGWAEAQSPDPIRTRFDVVSIKPNRSGSTSRSIENQGWRYVARNIPATSLIISAYRVPVESMLNTPGWVRSERFDIEAKIEAPDPRSVRIDRQQMFRNLLIDRFGAIIREISAPAQGYALVPAREDGRLGPQLKPSSTECPSDAAASATRQPSQGPSCGVTSDGEGSLRGKAVSLPQLASSLGQRERLVVVDKTNLDGRYDFDLVWAPLRRPDAPVPGRESGLAERADFFTAVREQLGLRLQPEDAHQGAIYIERIERPTPN